MKKLLALVLALVMTLGLATVGTNAATWSDLKDTDKVAADREEAFKVLNSIQIFEGDENNNLNPDAQLTRAEAAKIIATLNLGKTAADNLSGNGGKFSDVPASNWASGYIEYCASTGIIAGRGDGTFDPAGSLTFAAFSKMLLVSLGYVAEVEELVGGEWEFNVARIATTIDLYKGMDTPASKEIVKRADAAQMAFNVLKTPMVTYAYNGTNLLTNISAVGKTAAVYETTAARDTQTISTATVNDGSARGTYMVEFAERHFPKLVRSSHDVDDWGRPATTWTNNREEIGTFVNTDLLILSETTAVTGADVYKALGGSTLLSAYANDITRVGANNATFLIYEDGVNLRAGTAAQTATYLADLGLIVGNTDDDLAVSGEGTILEVFVDEDSFINFGVTQNNTARVPVITVVAINTWLAEAYADYNTNNKNLLLGVYTADNAPETRTASASNVEKDITGYKEGDWVLVKMTRDDNVIREVADPELLKAQTATAYTTNRAGTKMTSVTAEGEKYTVANQAHYDAAILNTYLSRELIGFTYDIFKDAYGNLIGIQYASKDTSLAFVVGIENASSALAATTSRANIIFMDGTMQTVNVATAANKSARTAINALAGANADGRYATVNAWFSYAKDEKGNITLVDIIPSSADGSAASNASIYHQYGRLLPNNNTVASVIPDIDKNTPTLDYAAAAGGMLRAIGDDNTVYISVAADDTVNVPTAAVGAIAKVNGVNKGIKNVSLEGTDLTNFDGNGTALTNFAAAQNNVKNAALGNVFSEANANAYFVFDNKGYVVAAVVVTDRASADKLMYVTGTVSLRETINGRYYDTYSVILEGESEVKKVKVDSLAAGYDTTGKLAANTLYAVAYDSTGEYVTTVENVDDATVKGYATLSNSNNGQRGYAVATLVPTTVAGNQIVLGDVNNFRNTNMIFVKNAAGVNLGHIATAASGDFWVRRANVAGTFSYTRYNTASAAWMAATSALSNGATGRVDSVYAMVEKASGYARTVVFTVTNVGGTAGTGAAATAGATTSIGATAYATNATWEGTDVVVRYNGTVTNDEIKGQIAALTGQSVTSYNKAKGIATLANGDTVDVTLTEVFVVTIDGTIVAEYDAGETIKTTDKITKNVVNGAYYILDGNSGYANSGTAAKATIDALTGIGNDEWIAGATAGLQVVSGNGPILKDYNLVTAYKIDQTAGAGVAFAKVEYEADGDGKLDDTLTDDYLVATGVKVKATSTTATVNGKYQLLTNTTKQGGYSVGDGTNARTYEYTVAKADADAAFTIALNETTPVYDVALGTTKGENIPNAGSYAFNGVTANSTFASVVELTAGNGTVATAALAGTASAGGVLTYVIDDNDAKNGSIELVQVVDIVTTGVSADFSWRGIDVTITAATTGTKYSPVGVVMTVTGGTKAAENIKVAVNAGGAGTVAAHNAADETDTVGSASAYPVAKVTLLATDLKLTFTQA